MNINYFKYADPPNFIDRSSNLQDLLAKSIGGTHLGKWLNLKFHYLCSTQTIELKF